MRPAAKEGSQATGGVSKRMPPMSPITSDARISGLTFKPMHAPHEPIESLAKKIEPERLICVAGYAKKGP